ncbi:MAG: glucose dehydrogenase [Gemmatimonadetes bacterium]|nr:glucose dehydrogenase [Gemmatimonadota bacterium]
MRRRPAPLNLLLPSAMLLLAACSSDSQQPPPVAINLALEPVATTFTFPILATAPTGDPRLFVVEKGGLVKVVKGGVVLGTPFLDVSGLISNGGEEGLLGLAFDPQYGANGRFFISYTNPAGDNVLASYQVSGNADVADAASAVIRLTVGQPYDNHNGGHIAFGPDGYLYMGIGDGGSGGDPNGHGQDRNDLLGSILRVDVSGTTGYAVPPGNPLVGVAGTRSELWNWGLRNPWRFSFDRSTGDLYIGDVGQNEREEIDVSTAASGGGRGLNYGWNIMEGTRCYNAGSCDMTGLTLPVLDYTHGDGCSVSGGYVYRGSAIPDLAGTYFYADFCSGWVRSFRYTGGQVTEAGTWSALAPGGSIPSFGEDSAGELYVLTAEGGVYRIVEH